MTLRLFICLLAFFFAARATAQPPVIFLVRHAERAATSGHVPSDTGLSPAGRKRADALARVLQDAQITAVYTTEYKRTRETAVPIAQSLGIQPEVGHSNTLPQIINALGVSSRVTVAESDYDNLFLIVLERPPRLIHLFYR